MKKIHHILPLLVVFIFWNQSEALTAQTIVKVSSATELSKAITEAIPGSEIILSEGVWKDIQIKFYGNGTEKAPITLRAETAGKVFITGQSSLTLGGEHLIVHGLYFTNGSSPSKSVIQYYLNEDTLANHCRVTNCVIEDYNKPQKNMVDLWVAFKGRHNQLDHCYLAGKANKGPTIRVDIKGNRSIKNHHKIQHNHFGPRPPKGGPSAETIQIGDSHTSVSPSYTSVENNLFERCDGEVEVISSKTNFNEFRNNVFYKSEGSLVTRHGNYCTIDGNYFIGDEHSSNYGGIRLIGTGHWVTNNYFYKLKGEVFRAPLAIMNGIRKSPLNRYIQVTDVVVAHNTYVDCHSPWQFGVGSNIDQKDVLPASEIRSETPIRTLVANNVIYNGKGDPLPIFCHDSIDGVEFKCNVINNNGVTFRGVEGLEKKDFSMKEIEKDIWIPSSDLSSVSIHPGFEFDQIAEDLFGNLREESNSVGATSGIGNRGNSFIDMSKYGPEWFDPTPSQTEATTHPVSTTDELMVAITSARNGDIIELTSKKYVVASSLKISKKLTIQSAHPSQKVSIIYRGPSMTPAFEMHPKGNLILKSIMLKGRDDHYAFAPLQKNMSSHYDLKVTDCEISDFDFVLKAHKHSFAQFIKLKSVRINNCNNGLELSSEDDDRGEYNAENLYVIDSHFSGVRKNVIDYYRGGYDESTIGGNLILHGTTFEKCGKEEKNGTLINTYGIINVELSENTFTNNEVKLVAQLWGAKNNSESDNIIMNSGKIVTEQNLPQKMMY